jgi:hypothetical protein
VLVVVIAFRVGWLAGLSFLRGSLPAVNLSNDPKCFGIIFLSSSYPCVRRLILHFQTNLQPPVTTNSVHLVSVFYSFSVCGNVFICGIISPIFLLFHYPFSYICMNLFRNFEVIISVVLKLSSLLLSICFF